MGRRTWESIGRPLPERQNIVVTRRTRLDDENVEVAHSLADAVGRARMPGPIFVIGGEALFREALPRASHLYMTEIDRDFAGDARFPAFDRAEWREVSRETHRLDGADGFTYHFAAYERAASAAL